MFAMVIGAFLVKANEDYIVQQLTVCGKKFKACWLSFQNCCQNRVHVTESELRINKKVYDWMEKNKKHLEREVKLSEGSLIKINCSVVRI